MKSLYYHKPLLGLAVITFIITLFLYGYANYYIDKMIIKTSEIRSTIQDESLRRSREKELKKVYESVSDKRATLASYFVPTDDVIAFIESIEGIQKQTKSNINITNISADSSENAQVGGVIKAHVEATGTWESVMRTLMMAETIPYRVIIERVRLDTSLMSDNPKKPVAREWKLSFDIQAVTKPK